VSTITAYVMNPETDVVLFGDQLAEGLLVLPESWLQRLGGTEDEQLRGQRFRTVTALRTEPSAYGSPAQFSFIGEWVDGYQAQWRGAISWTWIVSRSSIPEPAASAHLTVPTRAHAAAALAVLAAHVIASGDPQPDLAAVVLGSCSPLDGAERDAAWEHYLSAVRLEQAIEDGRAVWHMADHNWLPADPKTGAERSRQWSAERLAVLLGQDRGQSL
jgi:hypothetical protein